MSEIHLQACVFADIDHILQQVEERLHGGFAQRLPQRQCLTPRRIAVQHGVAYQRMEREDVVASSAAE